MDRAWTTRDASRGTEIDYWKQAVCTAIFELEVTFPRDCDVRASLRQRRVGPVGISHIKISGPQNVRRTKTAIARSKISQFELVHFMKGQAELRHLGHDVVLERGNCILIDSREPYELVTRGPCSSLSVHIPTEWLAVHVPRPELILARSVSAGTPWGAALVATLTAAFSHPTTALGDTLPAEQIMKMLYLAAEPATDTASNHRRRTYLRILEELEGAALSADLDATRLARDCGISTRYLHALFGEHDTTFRSQLRSVRLERATRMLRDPRFALLSAAEIARRCGFGEASHFSKVFREHFDTTPAAYRAEKLADAAKLLQ